MSRLQEAVGRRAPISETQDLSLFYVVQNNLRALGLDKMRGKEIRLLHDNLELALADASEFMRLAGKAELTSQQYIQDGKDPDVVNTSMNIFLEQSIKAAKKKMHILNNPKNIVVDGKEGQLVVLVRGRGQLIGKWNKTSQTYSIYDAHRRNPYGTIEEPDGFEICIGKVEKIDSASNEIAVSYIPVFSMYYGTDMDRATGGNKKISNRERIEVQLYSQSKPLQTLITSSDEILIQEREILRHTARPILPQRQEMSFKLIRSK